jgi:hypothetical protein
MSPEELSAKGNGGMRQMHNYVSATHDHWTIPTPEDTYRPDKIGGEISIDSLQQKRNSEIAAHISAPNLSNIGVMPGNMAVIPNSY